MVRKNIQLKKGTSKVGILGLGRMGRCLVRGVLDKGFLLKKDLLFTTLHEETAKALSKDLSIKACRSNVELVENCDVVILAVKPQGFERVLQEVKEKVSSKHLLISIAASISTKEIETKLGKKVPIVRAMPNTPAFVNEAMTALCPGSYATEAHLKVARSLFETLGRVELVDEVHFNAVTGLSGCGPAYIYMVLEALTEGGIKVGLPRDLATRLASQTVLGAAKMLQETGRHPSELRDEVTTPAGCTIDGLVELEEGKLRVTLMKAVVRATERAKVLAGN